MGWNGTLTFERGNFIPTDRIGENETDFQGLLFAHYSVYGMSFFHEFLDYIIVRLGLPHRL